MKLKNTVTGLILTAALVLGSLLMPSGDVLADLEQPEVTLPTLEEVKAAAFCVYDKTADEVILSRSPNERVYPASMTKIMTAMLALDYLDTSAYLTTSANAIENISSDSTVMGLIVGETTTVSELLYGLMLPSGNDAANVLAEGVIEALIKNYPSDSLTSGPDGINAKYFEDALGATSEEILADKTLSAFSLLMNYRANALGLKDTHFMNAHGLHNDEHYTTASDLAHIMAAAAENPTFRKLVHTPTHYFVATNMHLEDGWSIVNNSNKILMDPWLIAKVPGGEDTHAVCVVGGKTGSTSIAGTGMTIFTVNENGHELFAAVCGIPYDVYGYQTRYVASVAAYGNLECWNRDPKSVIPGTLGDYQSGNITEAERAQYDPLFLPGDTATEVEVPEATSEDPVKASETEVTGNEDKKEGVVASDKEKPEKKAKEELAVIKWAKEHMTFTIVIGVILVLLIVVFILIVVNLSRRKKRRKKRKTRPYIGEVIKD